jgi:AraC-like DNA-binding protein
VWSQPLSAEAKEGSVSMSDSRPIEACQSLIAEQLTVRYPTIAHTARLLGVPVRSLQRRLQQAGLSYSELVEKTRFELACRLLDAPDGSVAQVAKALGYADPGSFSRAFRRWTGMSPRTYRQRKQSKNPK